MPTGKNHRLEGCRGLCVSGSCTKVFIKENFDSNCRVMSTKIWNWSQVVGFGPLA